MPEETQPTDLVFTYYLSSHEERPSSGYDEMRKALERGYRVVHAIQTSHAGVGATVTVILARDGSAPLYRVAAS